MTVAQRFRRAVAAFGRAVVEGLATENGWMWAYYYRARSRSPVGGGGVGRERGGPRSGGGGGRLTIAGRW
jgi:hypothetical protein